MGSRVLNYNVTNPNKDLVYPNLKKVTVRHEDFEPLKFTVWTNSGMKTFMNEYEYHAHCCELNKIPYRRSDVDKNPYIRHRRCLDTHPDF